MTSICKAAAVALAALLVSTAVQAERSHRRERERERERPAPTAAADKRDRLVTTAGSFNGRAYWQAMAQCGGIYFKLNTLYSTAAVQAKVVKPDPAAFAQLTKKSNVARRNATVFFEAAERFLIADRGIARDDAVMTYDARANEEGERYKTVDAAEQATKQCPPLYQACRESAPKICPEPALSAGLPAAGT